MENILGLMTTRLGRMPLRAFKLDTLEILEAGFGRIRGSKPQIAGTMVVPFCTNDETGLAIAGNARTRGVNPLMACGACPFSKSDGPESTGDSMISSMTTEEGGTEVVLPRHFSKYSSQSFLKPTDIALLLVGGHRLAAMQLPLRIISLSIQMVPRPARL